MRIIKHMTIFGLVAIISLIGISCDLDSSTSTVETPSIVEPQIPDDFSNYESEEFFSIAYPSEWEPVQSYLEELETYGKEYVLKSDPEADVDDVRLVFMAGEPTDEGWYPSVTVTVTTREFGYSDLDEVIESECTWAKTYTPGYKELSRKKTTIGGVAAYIIKDQDDEPGYGLWKYTSGNLVKGDYVWFVICSAEAADFDEYEDTFNDVIRSFRVLN